MVIFKRLVGATGAGGQSASQRPDVAGTQISGQPLSSHDQLRTQINA